MKYTAATSYPWHAASGPTQRIGPLLTLNSMPQYLLIHYVHYGYLYSASSMLLLRSAADPCTAKKHTDLRLE